MRVLLVAATAAEIAPIIASLERVGIRGPHTVEYRYGEHDVDILVSGVGMVATAVYCARALTETSYDFALNIGVCGSFDPALGLATVVHVVSDRIAELGAEDGDEFLLVEELGLPVEADFANETPPLNVALGRLPTVRGITVNTVHGNAKSIADVARRFEPQIESMEGAAFMCAAQAAETPFAQVRAVSNRVERRNRAGWKMAEAIQALSTAVQDILAAL